MKRRCCCGCDIAWSDNFSADHLADYSKTGTWSRASNQLVGTSGSRIIGPGTGVTYFDIASPAVFSTGGIGDSDEIKLIIRWDDSSNYIYGRLKNNGGSGADCQFEIWKVVAGTATQIMANDWFATTNALGFIFGQGRLAISDRAGVISFGFSVSSNGLYSTNPYTGESYNRSTTGSFSDDNTISCYVAGSPGKCGIEIVSSAADLRFDDWFSGKGKKNLVYGVDNGCYRLLSRKNMSWQVPEVFTFDVMTINGLPGGWNDTIKAYWDLGELTADGGDGSTISYRNPCVWRNPEDTTTGEKRLNMQIQNATGGYNFELTTYSAASGYQWYYSDDRFPIDPTAGDIVFSLNSDGSKGPSWSGSNPLPMPASLTLSIVN